MISEGVDINGVHPISIWSINEPLTGLMGAMGDHRNKVVRLLLRCKDIKIDIKDKNDRTALHMACRYNNVEGVRLFLKHPTCNKEIVMMKNTLGKTAEMIADNGGNQECARLVREYLVKTAKRNANTEIGDLTLTEVAKRIEKFHAGTPLMKTKMEDNQKKELEKLDTDYTRRRHEFLKKIEAEYKRKREAALEKHDVENKKFCADNEKMEKALHQQLEKTLARSAGDKIR